MKPSAGRQNNDRYLTINNDRYSGKAKVWRMLSAWMSKSSSKEQTRASILAGAGRTFRSQGYGGAGVDGLAKAAGVTSGAFYAHFKSKADAFREAVIAGMQDLERGIRDLRAQRGVRWRRAFIDFYLSDRRTCAPTETCALQSLTGEVARADTETRAAFAAELRKVIATTAEGMPSASAEARRNEAIVTLALLSGGVSLARAVDDPALSEQIAHAIRAALLRPQKSSQEPTAVRRKRTS